MNEQIKNIDPERTYFLREVFLMGVIKRSDGQPAETFSTCREIVKENKAKLPWKKVGVFYQIKGSHLIKFLEEQEQGTLI